MVGWAYEGPYDHLDPQKSAGGYPNINQDIKEGELTPIQCHIVIDGGKDSEGQDMVVEGEGTGIVHMAGGCGSIDNLSLIHI